MCFIIILFVAEYKVFATTDSLSQMETSQLNPQWVAAPLLTELWVSVVIFHIFHRVFMRHLPGIYLALASILGGSLSYYSTRTGTLRE